MFEDDFDEWFENVYCADKGEKEKAISRSKLRHGVSIRYPHLYGTWNSMKMRCNNPNRNSYKDYGARGIYVCEEWSENPESFFIWAFENGYSDDLQLDRIDNDGPYSPENCRWVTPTENMRNTRRSKHLTLCGIRKTVAEWCETLEIDISPYTIYYWITEHGEDGCARRIYKRLMGEYIQEDETPLDIMNETIGSFLEKFIESEQSSAVIYFDKHEQARDAARELRHRHNAVEKGIEVGKRDNVVYLVNTKSSDKYEYHGKRNKTKK